MYIPAIRAHLGIICMRHPNRLLYKRSLHGAVAVQQQHVVMRAAGCPTLTRPAPATQRKQTVRMGVARSPARPHTSGSYHP